MRAFYKLLRARRQPCNYAESYQHAILGAWQKMRKIKQTHTYMVKCEAK